MDPSTAGQLGNLATSILGTGAQAYGQQNAAEAVEKANAGAINNQTTYLGNIGTTYQPYLTGGAGAESALQRLQGTAPGQNGTPDYSGFENMPGYKFAIDQGTQALQRQASAMGNAYTPNTAAAIGQYVTGTAMQDYNTYVQQLQAQATQGATAANQFGNIQYNTGANTSQLMSNTGQSQAGMYTGMGQTIAGALGSGAGLPPGLAAMLGMGPGGGTGAAGNIASLFTKGISSLFGPSGTSSSDFFGPNGNGTTPGANWTGPSANDTGGYTGPDQLIADPTQFQTPTVNVDTGYGWDPNSGGMTDAGGGIFG